MEVAKLEGRLRLCYLEKYDGHGRNFICGNHQYCCALGCCVSTSFTFYQLWYFWLLLLLMILICSGVGWWFRWRHLNFSTRTPTPRRRRRGDGMGRHGRIYPHQGGQYPPHIAYSLPGDVDKDPPSYNEVVRHLSHFPPASSVFNGYIPQSYNTSQENNGDCWAPTHPPPSYEMVLDLKRKQQQLDSEIRQEESSQNNEASLTGASSSRPSARDRIRLILGLNRAVQSNNSPDSQENSPFVISSSAPIDIESNHLPTIEASIPVQSITEERLPILPQTMDQLNPPPYRPPAPAYTNLNSETAPSPLNTLPPFTISNSNFGTRYHPSSSSDSVPSTSFASQDSFVTSPTDHSSSYNGSYNSIYSETGPHLNIISPPPIRSSSNPEDVDHCSTFEESRSRSRSSVSIKSGTELSTSPPIRSIASMSTLSRPSTSISVRSLTSSNNLERKSSCLPGEIAEADEKTYSGQGSTTAEVSNSPQDTPSTEQT